MLANILIIDPTWADLVSQTTLFCEVVDMITTIVKDGRCYNQYPTNMFLLLTMEVFSDGFLC
jgi:hypothetical protein